MNSTITALALALTTIGSFAGEITLTPEIDNAVSTRTRAEVRAEVQTALASGWRSPQGELGYPAEHRATGPSRTRAEVRAEVLAAIARGERLSYGEASNYPQFEHHRGAPAPTTVATRKAQVIR